MQQRLNDDALDVQDMPAALFGTRKLDWRGLVTTTAELAELSANALCNKLWHGGAL
jgi:hypothetical protein